MNKSLFLFLLSIGFLSSPLYSQNFLRGRITELGGGNAVPYANVNIGPSTGTASNENGEFLLEISNADRVKRITFSSLGYQQRILSVDSLLQLGSGPIQIKLSPISVTLDEVTIMSKKISAHDVAQEAIDKISTNYTQTPFSMEFYSKIMVKENTETRYLVENIITTYRNGYVEGAGNKSTVTQTRISGENPVPDIYDKKNKVKFFAYEKIAVFDIFIADMIGVGKKYDFIVFNPDFFKKLTFEHAGVQIFEGDTANVIDYYPKNSKRSKSPDRLVISAKDQAILKHSRTLGVITFETSYRKWGNHYFPYFIKATYPKEKSKGYDVVLEIYIRKVTEAGVNADTHDRIEDSVNGWHLSDIPYNASYWEANYPIGK